MLSTCIISQQNSNCVCLPRLKRSIYCGDSQQMLRVLIHSCLLYHSKQFVLPPHPRASNSTTYLNVFCFFFCFVFSPKINIFFHNCPSWLKGMAHLFVLYNSKTLLKNRTENQISQNSMDGQPVGHMYIYRLVSCLHVSGHCLSQIFFMAQVICSI